MSTKVLHGTWLPGPRRFFLWGESVDLISVLRPSRKGRQPKIPVIPPHPFGSTPAQLREYLDRHSLPAADLEEQARTILLPSAGKGPVPSPELLSGGAVTPPEGEIELRAWQVTGLACPPAPAVDLLLALGSLGSPESARGLGADLRTWHLVGLCCKDSASLLKSSSKCRY